MKICFKEILLKNFLSYGDNLDNNRITLDTGTMTLFSGKNGAGKSTFLDALCFALYGKPFRNIKKDQLINSVNGKNCEVHLTFDVNKNRYLIIRGIKPHKFEIYKNNELYEQNASIKDYQVVLDGIINCSYTSFTNLIVMGSAKFSSFMNLPVSQRRQIVSNVLDIDIFNVMSEILGETLIENKNLLADVDGEIKIKEKELEIRAKQLTDLQNSDSLLSLNKMLSDAEKDFKETFKSTQAERDELERLQKELIEFTEQRNYDEEVSNSKLNKSLLEADAKKDLKSLSFYKDHDKCESCQQELEPNFKAKKIHDLTCSLKNNKNSIEEISFKLKDSQEKLKIVNDKKEEIKTKENIVSNSKKKMKESMKKIEELKALIEKNKEDKTSEIRSQETIIQEVNFEYQKLLTDKKNLEIEKSCDEIIKLLLKDSGIKAQIIKQWLPTLNTEINRVLDALDASYSFELDEQFNETIKSRYRDTFSYSSFSEGEKARIDASILFAFREVAKRKSTIDCNILVLDEILDGSLDSDATEILLTMLNQQDISIFVVSHKTEASNHFPRIVEIEKKGNFSVVREP